jgi:nitrite reductase/ring-hydroxylating ferredoxin subunit
MTRHLVCRADQVVGNAVLPVMLGRGKILLTRLPSGEIKAIASRCPHQGADLQHGCLTGHVHSDEPNVLLIDRPGQILRCPWHGFEFDVCSGESVADHGKLRLRGFDVEIENGDVFIVM